MKSLTYFLYARKSTEDEERQQLSIPAQIDELRSFAQKENLTLVDVLTESKTAKQPGRPIFNEMLERIQSGEATGILSWNPFMSIPKIMTDHLPQSIQQFTRIVLMFERLKHTVGKLTFKTS